MQNEYYKHPVRKFIDHAFMQSKKDYYIREKMDNLESMRQKNARYELIASFLDQQYRKTVN